MEKIILPIFALYIFLYNIYGLNCTEIAKKLYERDLIVHFKSNNIEDSYLEAYKSPENDRILLINDTKRYRNLKWYSMGHPFFIRSQKTILNKTMSIFHFTSKGFYGSIQALTGFQKNLLIQAAKNLYGTTIEPYQIEHLRLTTFTCEISLHDEENDEEVKITGKVDSFKKYPLRIHFEADSLKQKLFKSYLDKNESFIEFDCEIKSKEASLAKDYFRLRIEPSEQVNID